MNLRVDMKEDGFTITDADTETVLTTYTVDPDHALSSSELDAYIADLCDAFEQSGVEQSPPPEV